MRIALVVHGLPPYSRNGVENHAQALAEALADRNVSVEVFAPRALEGLAHFAQRREEREGWAVTWVNVPVPGPGRSEHHQEDLAAAFAAFLEREVPDLVHFEHLAEVGLGAVLEARRRDVPTVYVAHDYFSATDSYTLLAPDLTQLELGDRGAEARALLAREYLDTLAALGDHHGMVREEDLEPDQWSRLQAILRAEPGEVEGLERAREKIVERLDSRRSAFAAVDARFATSRTLTRELSSYLGRAVDWRPAGIALGRFNAESNSDDRVQRRAQRASGPLRFGYMGAVLKHKGAHLLLDSFSRLDRDRAELSIHGGSGDRVYVHKVRERCAALGVGWGGAYLAQDAPDILRDLDVLVVPSLWSEIAPFVIQEAFAAGCPVIVPRTEHLEELVSDGRNGLFFERGDVASLAETMDRMLREEGLIEHLEEGLSPAQGIEDEVEQWLATYAELIEQQRVRAPQPVLPAHLVTFAERHKYLSGQSTRALFSMVSNGLEALGDQMGLRHGLREFLTSAVGRGSLLRDTLVDDRRTIDWLERSAGMQAQARRDLEQRSSWHEEQLGEFQEKLRWYEEQVRGRQVEFEGIRHDHERLGRAKADGDEALQSLEREREWLSEALRAKEAVQAQLDAGLSAARASIASLREERAWLKQTLDAGGEELGWLRSKLSDAEARENLADREAMERHFASLEDELGALKNHEEWLRGEVCTLVESLAAEATCGGADAPSDHPEQSTPAEMELAVQTGFEALRRIVAELGWRREEMSAARESAKTLFTRIAARPLAGRALSWSAAPTASDERSEGGGVS